MSRYLVDKLLYHVDRDPTLLAAYAADPAGTVARWEGGAGSRIGVEPSSVHRFTDAERAALAARDIAALYALGAHPFVLWTCMLPLLIAELGDRQSAVEHYRSLVAGSGHPDFAT